MSQADTYCAERYWCPVGVSVRSGVTCPCWNSSQANSAASAPHYHLLCGLIEAPSGHSLHLHHLFCRDFSLKFGSVAAAGVCALLFPEIACQSNSVVSAVTSFALDFLWVAYFSDSHDDFLTAEIFFLFSKWRIFFICPCFEPSWFTTANVNVILWTCWRLNN